MNPRKIARNVLLRRFRLERSYRPPTLVRHPQWNFEEFLKLVVAYHLQARSEFTFLQVGAFDGGADDPIHPLVRAYGLRGIVVEPQAGAFEALKARYADHPQVALVNAAVADADGTRDFYTTRSGSIEQASFHRSHLLKHKVPAEQIICQAVRCVTITSLLAEHGLHRLDLLQVDAEGYDYEILRTIDFELVRPSVIRFEHAHLSEAKANECVEWLASHDYRFIAERRDLIALLEA